MNDEYDVMSKHFKNNFANDFFIAVHKYICDTSDFNKVPYPQS